jgi:hypothetical protein
MNDDTPDSSTEVAYERRRQVDRRKDSRSGKLDRRHNRCGGCMFYAAQNSEKGLCQKHQKVVAADEFACVWFQATTASP